MARTRAIVRVRQGIELMSMAASAVQGQTEERLTHGADQLLQLFFAGAGAHPGADGAGADIVVRSGDEEAAGDHAVRCAEDVAGQLLLDEESVGFVLVEGRGSRKCRGRARAFSRMPVVLEAVAFAQRTGDVRAIARGPASP